MKRVCLGDYTFTKVGDEKVNMFTTLFNDIQHEAVINLICSKYKSSRAEILWNEGEDKIISNRRGVSEHPGILVEDKTYSDASTFNTSLSDVYLDYALATPIEYELISPLVPTVKAGTTEARVSPNANGLSAPMVCDMTYDVDSEYILGDVNDKLGDIESILETI